ncbi:terminase gpA endonuclease subunit [Methylobrevis pamukkalensis]|uniref:terminase gpA endonuclease subunit n=1 Tax=Methylobrevis pamukkalensis TaxID=1439726 RepID=UPI001FDA8B50|nr:terminase gpA endonuclease subunit [Methylobrevis pamukkalensis]
MPPLPLSQWLEKNLVLVDGPQAGELWSAEGAPYLAEIADCLGDDHPANLVTVRKSQQTGASVLAIGWCLYVAEREPANMLYAGPGIDWLRDVNGQKLQPAIDAWQKKIRREVFVPQTSRSGTGSTTYEKKFPGGYLALANANAVMDLSGKTVKKGVKDELSKWTNIPGRGDPETLFFGRFTAFRRLRSYKILEVSTPEVDTGDDLGEAEGHCRIDRSFRRSDQRFWHVPCPQCGDAFVQTFEAFRIDRDTPDESYMETACCGYPMREPERVLAVRAGFWRATESGPDRHPGFHIDGFVSLMMSYGDMARDYIAAERRGETGLKDYANLNLGLPYQFRGDAPDHVRLMERREDYPENRIPAAGLLLVAGCDVQHAGIWAEVVAYGRDRQSWCVSKRWLEGDTTDQNRGAFTKLDELLGERFPDAFGGHRTIDMAFIDSGDGTGGRTHQVYAFTRGRATIKAIKGSSLGWSAPAVGTPSKVDINLKGQRIRNGAMVWPLGTWSLKAEWYSQLKKPGIMSGADVNPPGYCHFGMFLDETYFKQITSEYLAEETNRGRTVKKWFERGENHLLDCRIYAMAAAEYLGLTRMSDEQWATLAMMRGVPAEMAAADLLTPAPLQVQTGQVQTGTAKPAAAKRAADEATAPKADSTKNGNGRWLAGRRKGFLK